ncbi:MAG: glycosyl hydrolase 115 family protein, partial [Bacteroidota bacterium]|nr:glycosyl hydrolase 115 family protein [Bacteroidota bacterium]
MNKHLLSLSLFLLAGLFVKAADFVLYHDHQVVPVVLIDGADDPVMAAANLFKDDYQSVTGQMPTILNKADGFNLKVPCVLVGTVGKNKTFDKFLALNHVETTVLMKHPEAFRLQVLGTTQNQFLLILGSDPHGTAYGLLELSRFIGVSPWIWWADATPVKQTSLIFPSGNIIQQYPSVRYRGIFINDEDWGLMPWATKTLQPDCPAGAVGPEAYERVCQLLLRLRANLLWPAMHACTTPFFFVAGNADMAKRYGIYLGSSHCEPFLCNIHGEWDRKQLGDYNYATNADTVLAYWRARVEQTKDMPTIYTIGMRGEHDEKMQGANTVDEQKILLQRVLDDQRRMLQEATGKQPEIVPQVFVPYKEVLDVYDAGLKVPEDVTLIWCDDNYGYISRLSNTEEALRSGGAGVYYHISYWGRPHDYLWLATTTPALIRFEMNRAWEKGARKLWVLNVGDIKPGEYLTEYFMDMAWSLGEDSLTTIQPSDSNELPYTKHLNAFMSREFGADNAATLTSVMQRFYQLATIRKPEHMGWDKVEEPDYPKGFTPLVDTEFSQKEIDSRLQAYAVLENQVRTIEERLPGDKRAAYFQLVAYPVYGASLLNQKILYAQLARQFESNDSLKAVTYAAASLFAYQEI